MNKSTIELRKFTAVSAYEDNINWYDINYPPSFPIIHYKSEELENNTLYFVKVLKITSIILFCVLLVNLLTTIISVAAGYILKINILYCFLNLYLILSLHLFIGYTGYYSLAGKNKHASIRFIIISIIENLFICLIIVLDNGSFNGILRLVKYVKLKELGAYICLVLGIFEITAYSVLLVFNVYILYCFIIIKKSKM